MMNERWMELTLTSGKKLRFKFPVQATDETVIQRLEEVLSQSSVAICADNILYVIPTTSIQMATVVPAPKKLPRTVIRSAKVME